MRPDDSATTNPDNAARRGRGSRDGSGGKDLVKAAGGR